MAPSRGTRGDTNQGRPPDGWISTESAAGAGIGAVMQIDTSKKAHSIPLKHYGWILIGVWTLVAAASLGWNLLQDRDEALRVARHIALTNYERDVLYRRWAAAHGGVYVPVTPDTPPTPYLARVPERDIVTPSGRRLTLLNPAYMTRQIYELAQESGLPRGHLTSLKPLRPQNAPDPWEKKALEAFEHGKEEVSEVVSIDGQPSMRLMRPFRIDPSCLTCHEEQGYKVGDIRGGISVSVPMNPIMPNGLAYLVSRPGTSGALDAGGSGNRPGGAANQR